MTKYIPGDFSFIDDEMKEALIYDYHVIDELVPGAWNALKNHDPNKSFMFHKKFPKINWLIHHYFSYNGNNNFKIGTSLSGSVCANHSKTPGSNPLHKINALFNLYLMEKERKESKRDGDYPD